MTMNIVKEKRNGKTYVYLRESFWDPVRRKYSSRNIKKYGELSILEAENPNFLDDLEKEIQQLREDKKSEKQRQVAKRAREIKMALAKDFGTHKDNERFLLGPYVYKRIWDKLNLTRKLRDSQKAWGISFDFAKAVFFMSMARSLYPDSKFAQWNRRHQIYVSAKSLQLQHLYRSLDILSDNKEMLTEYVNRQIAQQYKRKVTVALYDVTTYYFESCDETALRCFGFSKDNKVNRVQVVMGLLIDDQGIPIDYELYSGNTSEFATMIPILRKLKQRYRIDRVIIVADRGLNSASNLVAIREMGMQYVMAYRLRGSGEKYKKLIEDGSGWLAWKKTEATKEISKYRITDEIRKVKIRNGDETKAVELRSKLLIHYSPARARKEAYDRERLVEKARKLAGNTSLLKSELKRGGKSYLQLERSSWEASVDEERIKASAFWDGYYGIVYSDESMSASEVMKVHHSLWQIEESFRISKSLLEARPCFHWTEKRIRGHFLICYMGLVLHRLLEAELSRQGMVMSAERIIHALRSAMVTEVPISENERAYFKTDTVGDFEMISQAVGLGSLLRISTATELKQALRVRNL